MESLDFPTPLPRPVTLLEFAQRISRRIAASAELQSVWVVAELSDFRYAGRHAYANLLEKDNSGNTVATLRATIWNNAYIAIDRKFRSATGRGLENGMKVMLRLTAGHHPQFGLSANITDIDPAYSLGDMERLRREILERLRRDGVYDDNRSLPLDPAPLRIAVISAEGAAGYGDFLNHINSSRYAFRPRLFPAMMQGGRTVPTVLEALRSIEDSAEMWDCVIIIRGGGASTDLNGFDDYTLAYRVATFPLPVIVGIGHERDNTVLDYIANTRCKTPTAVAHFLIETLDAAMLRAEDLTKQIVDRVRLIISEEQRHLAYITPLLSSLPTAALQREESRIQLLRTRISQGSGVVVARASNQLATLAGRISTATSSAIARAGASLDSIPQRIAAATDTRTRIELNRLDAAQRLIAVLDPRATLKRGYSITRVGGHAIRSAGEVHAGDTVITTLSEGTITTKA